MTVRMYGEAKTTKSVTISGPEKLKTPRSFDNSGFFGNL
jgi:hypothetical protein